MTNLRLSILGLIMLWCEMAGAQSLIGTWQGILRIDGQEQRTVVKISRSQAGEIQGALYSIDQGGVGIPIDGFARGISVTLSVPGLLATFEGKSSIDGNSMSGTWTQRGKGHQLILTRATTNTVWPIPQPDTPGLRRDATLAFAAAAIKPSRPEAQRSIVIRGRGFVTVAASVTDLLTFAYGIHRRQITNVPQWIETEKYDISAVPEGDGRPSTPQVKIMVQGLLEERFGLKFHWEQKELSVFRILAIQPTPKLVGSLDPNINPGVGLPGPGVMTVKSATMSDFAGYLQRYVLDQPVIDGTGLSGKYDFTLNWTPEPGRTWAPGNSPPPPQQTAEFTDFFTAIQQQLGLKVVSARTTVAVISVDRIEKPSTN